MILKKFRRFAWTSCLCLGLTGGIAHAAAADSDGDGLSDAQELNLDFDPNAIDSNMDGISDFDAFMTSGGRAAAAQGPPAAPPIGDVDNDGIRDFLETYGYYVEGSQLVGVKRVVPRASWDAFAARGRVLGFPVFQLATNALKSNQLARLDVSRGVYVVDVAAAYNVIFDSFINGGVPQFSPLVAGSTADEGSIAWIMAFLVTEHGYEVPTNSSGQALPVYTTHPLRASSDNDPYLDSSEALGIFNGERPEAPADHPLVAALPSIRAKLVSYKLTDISASSVVLGEQATHADVVRQSTSFAQSRGLTTQVNVKYKALSWPAEVEFGPRQSNQWTFGSSVTAGDRNAHTTLWQQASHSCVARLALTVELENVGAASASNIATSLNVFLGDTLWRSVTLTTSGSGLTLPAHARKIFTALGQGTQQSCLTVDETNYLEQGGLIGIETATDDATFVLFDPFHQGIVRNGSWNLYRSLIERELARIDLNVATTTGVRVSQSFWVTAPRNDYPNLSLSIEEVLGRIYPPFPCSNKGLSALICFTTDVGDVALTANAAVDFAFHDEFGNLLSRPDSSRRYETQEGDNDRPLTKRPAQRTVVSIFQDAYYVPVFSHLEVVSELLSQQPNSSTAAVDMHVRALVRDFYGVDKVQFCYDTAETRCTDMASTAGTATHPFSGQYEISLGQYTFTGGEHLRAWSVGGGSTQQAPQAFFLTLGESLQRTLSTHRQRYQDKLVVLGQLEALRRNNPAEYSRIVNGGLMASVEAARSILEQRWQAVLDDAASVCAYSASSRLTAAGLAVNVSQCLEYLRTKLPDAFNENIPVYNLKKLPFRSVDGVETNWDNSTHFDIKSMTCRLQPGQFLVGISLTKVNNAATPTAWLTYVTWDALTRTVSEARTMEACGPAGETEEALFGPKQASSSTRANLILDVGASIGGRWSTNRNNDEVTRLCVAYREFDFAQQQFVGSRKLDCDREPKLKDTEARTSGLLTANQDRPLFGLMIGGSSDGKLRYLRGNHLRDISLRYGFKPYQQLVSGGRYRIETTTGAALTVRGTTPATRVLAVEPSRGTDDQIWEVEAVNDREFRLTPLSYVGFISRGSLSATTVISVNAPLANDSNTVNFLQHWRLEQLPGGDYLIQSALGDEEVLTSSITLRTYNYAEAARQQWSFIRLDDPRPRAPTPAQSVNERAWPEVGTQTFEQLYPQKKPLLSNIDYDCATKIDISDGNGRPRYFNRIAMRAKVDPALADKAGKGTRYTTHVQVLDDARQVRQAIQSAATREVRIAWPTTDRAAHHSMPVEVDFPRYILAKEIRLCGTGQQVPGVVVGFGIEALCRRPSAAPFGPVAEVCKAPARQTAE